MSWLTDEVMFYGGIAITVFSFILGGIFIGMFKYNLFRLKIQFDEEYGKEDH